MEKLLAQYEARYPFYQALAARLQACLRALLERQPLHIHAVTGRAKARQSLADKLERGGGKYRALADVTDLCGIRVITYYEDEVDLVCACIRKNFQVDEANSVDKRKLLQANAFGYASLHLIVELPLARAAFACEGPGDTCKVEIQIRSLLQHAWAEIEHDLAYKQPARQSYAARRRFSRLAGLLEMADQEFERLRDSADERPKRWPEPLPALPKPQSAPRRLPVAWATGCAAVSVFLALLLDVCLGPKLLHLAAVLSAVV